MKMKYGPRYNVLSNRGLYTQMSICAEHLAEVEAERTVISVYDARSYECERCQENFDARERAKAATGDRA